jgi:hypothetical protein
MIYPAGPAHPRRQPAFPLHHAGDLPACLVSLPARPGCRPPCGVLADGGQPRTAARSGKRGRFPVSYGCIRIRDIQGGNGIRTPQKGPPGEFSPRRAGTLPADGRSELRAGDPPWQVRPLAERLPARHDPGAGLVPVPRCRSRATAGCATPMTCSAPPSPPREGAGRRPHWGRHRQGTAAAPGQRCTRTDRGSKGPGQARPGPAG